MFQKLNNFSLLLFFFSFTNVVINISTQRTILSDATKERIVALFPNVLENLTYKSNKQLSMNINLINDNNSNKSKTVNTLSVSKNDADILTIQSIEKCVAIYNGLAMVNTYQEYNPELVVVNGFTIIFKVVFNVNNNNPIESNIYVKFKICDNIFSLVLIISFMIYYLTQIKTFKIQSIKLTVTICFMMQT